MAMADNRLGRYSPPSKSNHFPKLPSFASPTAPSNASRKLDHFSPVSDALSPLPGLSPTLDRRNHERGSDLAFTSSKVIVRLRRLPRNFGNDALRSMLLFAKDLDDTKFVESEYHLEDTGFSCAVATFHSIDGAREVQSRLNGKPNATNDANMIIEVLPNVYTGPRRNTGDGAAARQQSGSASSTSSSNNPLSRQSSRFSTSFQTKDFQPKEKVSPPMGSPTATSKDFPAPDGTNSLKNLFSPRSPVANHYFDHRRISGKDVIGNDGADDETTQLLSDPLAFYQNDHHQPPRFGNPLPNFGGLSLNTSNVDGNSNRLSSPNDSGFASPRSMRSPPSAQSPAGMPNISANSNFGMNFGQNNYPAINPADQHPPCNTLYVGNLPMDANEDELKQIFTKQRGFKRLCYRMKHNGPMCFVEFEDTSYAIKALGELYGVPLHNSYRGGMRLSFSKNPLGVRSGQNGQQSSISPVASHPFSNGAGAPPGFAAANGPPPGLLPPGGVRSPTTYAPPPPALDPFGRGFAPRFPGSGSHARTQQPFAGGYSNGPLNGAYSSSMNGIFMDHPSGR